MRTANFSHRQLDAATHMHAICVHEDEGNPILWEVTLYLSSGEALFQVATRTINDNEYMQVRKALSQEGWASRLISTLGYVLIPATLIGLTFLV